MSQKYERTIGLKTIWITFIRRFKIIFLIFIPAALASVIFTQFLITKTYISSTTYYNAGGFTVAKYPIVYTAVKSITTAETVANNLAGADEHKVVKHSNGSPITKEEIYSGITIATSISANTSYVSFTFQSSDKSITKAVLEEVATVALPEITKTFKDTTISSHASDGTKNSNDNKYMLIGLVVGAVLALGFAFADEVFSDEVFDKYDAINLGSDGFEITASK